MKDQEGEILDYYVLFPNHHQGLLLHHKLKEKEIKATITPTPREARNLCGISLRVAVEELEEVKQVIADEKVEIEGIIPLPRKKSSGYK